MNRYRHANTVPLASIAIWVAVCLFACCAGLGYVWLKNDLHAAGSKIRNLEQELHELLTQDEVVRAKIASLSSRTALQRRVNEGFVKLVPITDDRLTRVAAIASRPETDLRPVSNERRTP